MGVRRDIGRRWRGSQPGRHEGETEGRACRNVPVCELRGTFCCPPAVVERTAAARRVAVRQALGDAPDEVVRAFNLLSGSMIHDLYTMRATLGLPSAVLSAEIWQEGRAVTFTLAYPSGARCVATWIDLPDLWDFKE